MLVGIDIPERTSSTSRRRNSGGYGAWLFGIVNPSSPSVGVSTKPGQLHAAIEAFLGLGPTFVEFEDDFEDGLDPAWLVWGTTQTIAPTGDCGQAYWSLYSN